MQANHDMVNLTSQKHCDKEFPEEDEPKRKILHDEILNELGVNQQVNYSWGKITSSYDARSNLSCINIVYAE